MRKAFLFALTSLAFAACDLVESRPEHWEYRCNADSSVCWHENTLDKRNTPANEPH